LSAQYIGDDAVVTFVRQRLAILSGAGGAAAAAASAAGGDEGEVTWRTKDGVLYFVQFVEAAQGERINALSSGAGGVRAAMVSLVCTLLRDENTIVRSSAAQAAGEMLKTVARSAAAGKATSGDDTVLTLCSALVATIGDEVAQVRQDSCTAVAAFAQINADCATPAALDVLLPALLARSTDANGPARRASQHAMFYLLKFHRSVGEAEKALNSAASRIAKRDATLAQTLVGYVRKSILVLTPSSDGVGADGAAADTASSSAAATA
jgi:hypothetical protein